MTSPPQQRRRRPGSRCLDGDGPERAQSVWKACSRSFPRRRPLFWSRNDRQSTFPKHREVHAYAPPVRPSSIPLQPGACGSENPHPERGSVTAPRVSRSPQTTPHPRTQRPNQQRRAQVAPGAGRCPASARARCQRNRESQYTIDAAEQSIRRGTLCKKHGGPGCGRLGNCDGYRRLNSPARFGSRRIRSR